MWVLPLLAVPLLPVTSVQEQDTASAPLFADPIQLTRDGEPHTGIYYPSPVLHDLDGDGQVELVIGDLMGRVIYSQRIDGQDTGWGPSQAIEAQGKPLKLDNW